jgi:predicted LPLAT superfamily acyltransferase
VTNDWKQRPEGGGWFALWLIRNIGRYGGRGVGRLLLYPITLYFLLRRAPEREASRRFLGRVLGRPATLRDVARHIHTFASTILDRIFLLSG